MATGSNANRDFSPSKGRRRWTPKEIQQALDLYRSGKSYADIARIMRRNTSSVGYIIRREDMAEEARLLAEEAQSQQET